MSQTLRLAPRPRSQKRTPAYPALHAVAMASVLTACASQPNLAGPRWVEPQAPRASGGSSQVLVMAGDPSPTTVESPGPRTGDGMEVIEDPQGRSIEPGCAGECPPSYGQAGPRADLRFRVEAGQLPEARTVLSGVQPALHRCVVRDARYGTWVQVQASVGPDGRVAPIEVRSELNTSSELASCIANTILGSRFNPSWRASTFLVIVNVVPP